MSNYETEQVAHGRDIILQRLNAPREYVYMNNI